MTRRAVIAESLGPRVYKVVGAAWVTFVLVYLPLAAFTSMFSLVPDTWPEIGLLLAGSCLAGIGPHDPPEVSRWKMRRAARERQAEENERHLAYLDQLGVDAETIKAARQLGRDRLRRDH